MEYLLTNVNDWLKHAEGKHAVLIGLNSAIIGLVVNLLNFTKWAWSISTIYILWMIALIVISIIHSITSYLPILDSEYFNKHKKNTIRESLNPMFFGDIAELDPKELVCLLLKENDGECETNLWVAEQIVTNSRIAARKYRFFEKAVWLSFFALFPPIALIMAMIRFIVRRSNMKK